MTQSYENASYEAILHEHTCDSSGDSREQEQTKKSCQHHVLPLPKIMQAHMKLWKEEGHSLNVKTLYWQ